MPVIDGYTFVMDLQDRGVMKNLRGMKQAMQVLKNEMRTGFQQFQASEGTLSAYNFKLKESANIIKEYQHNINELSARYSDYKTKLDEAQNSVREEKANLEDAKKKYEENSDQVKKAAKAYDQAQKDLKHYSNEVRQAKMVLDRYDAGLAQTRQQQEKAREMLERMKTGLYDYRRETEAITKANKSFTTSLRESGNYFKANRTGIWGLKVEQEALSKQYKAEKEVLSQLETKQSGLLTKYKQERATLSSLTSARTRAKNELTQATQKYGAESQQASKAKAKLDSLNESYEKQKRVLSGFPERISNVSKEYSEQAQKASAASAKLRTLDNALGHTKFSYAKAQVVGFGQSISQFNQRLKQSTSNTREWASSLKGGLVAAGAGMTAVGAGVGKATKMAADMQTQWVNIKNLLVTGGESAGKAVQNVGLMERDASKYSKEYGLSQKEIAEQYTNLVKRGYDSKAALGAMKSELEATRATGDDFEDVVNNASSALDAFGLRTDNVAQMSKNTKRVLNSMAYAADMTATDFKDLGEGMSFVSSTASQAGLSVEETSAALGVLSNAGVEGTRAGTGLRKVLNSLISPTKGASDALQSIGLSTKDFRTQAGKLKPVTQIFKEIENAMDKKKLTQAEKMDIFHSLFGTTGQQAGAILAQSNKDLGELVQKVKKANKGQGYVHQLAQKNMQTTQMQMKKLQMTFQDMAINVGKQMLPAINSVTEAFSKWTVSKEGKEAINGMTSAAKGFAQYLANHTKDIMDFFSGVVDGAKNAFNFLKTVTTPIRNFIGWLDKKLGGGKKDNPVAKFVGIAVGALAVLAVPLAALKKAFQGTIAIGKDLGKLKDWVKGNKYVNERNAYMQKLIELQEQSIKLTKEQIELDRQNTKPTGGNGNSTTGDIADIATDVAGNGPVKEVKTASKAEKTADVASEVADTVDIVASAKGGNGAKIAKDVEEMGAKHARFWQKGWLGKFIGWSKKLLSIISPSNITDNLMQKMANLGDKSGGAFKAKFLRSLKTIGHYINPLTWFKGIYKVGAKIGSGLVKAIVAPIKGIGKFIKSPIQTMANLGDKWASTFNGSFTKKMKASKINPKNWFKGSSKAAEEAGADASKGFWSKFKGLFKWLNPKNWFKGASKAGAEAGAKASTGVLGKIKAIPHSLNPKNWFKGVTPAATEAGEAGSKGLIGKFATKFPKLTGMAKGVFGKMGGIANVAFSAIDLISALREKNPDKKWKGIGSSAGGLIGGALGTTLGPFGTIAGSMLGSKIGEVAGPTGGKFARGFQSWFNKGVKKHDWSMDFKSIGKGWNQFWGGMGDWWDQTFRGKKPKESKSTKSKTPSSQKIKSLGGNNYSKTDIANIKAMNKAVKDYIGTLEKLKGAIKKSDPTKELEAINSGLIKQTKGWKKAISPIKELGKAFSTLAKFTASMAKKDGFSALTKDLPKLASALKNNASKIKDGLKKLNSAFSSGKGKGKSGLISNISSIGNALSKLQSKIKGLPKSLSSLASSFKSLATQAKRLISGKSTIFEKIGNGLDKMQTKFYHITRGKNSIGNLLNSVASSIKKSKLSSFLNGLKTPLKDITSYLKSMDKPLDHVSSSFYSLAKSTKQFTNSRTNPFTTIADGLKSLKSALGDVKSKGGLVSQLDALSTAFGGKGKKNWGFADGLKQVSKYVGSVASAFKTMDKPFSSFVSSVNKIGGGTQKKNPLTEMANGLKALKSALGGKKNNTLANELKELSEAMGGATSGKGKGKKQTTGLASAFTDLNKPLKNVASSFKQLQKPVVAFSKAMKPFGGKSKKNNPLDNLADGFKTLDKALKTSGKNSVVTKIKDFVKALQGGTGKSKSKSLDNLLNDINKPLKKMASYVKGLGKPLEKASISLKKFDSALNLFKSKKTDSISNITTEVRNLYLAMKKYPFGKEMEKQAEYAEKSLSGRNFATLFSDAVKDIKEALTSFKRSFNKSWKDLWDNIAKPVQKGLDKADTYTYRNFKSIQSRRESFSKTFLSGWKNWINQVLNLFRNGMNKLPGYASSAMNSVISRMNRGIGGVNAVIGEFGGDKKLSTIKYANGTDKGHPGGHMLVNDSKKPHWKELVKFPGKPWTMFDQKDTFIPNAPKGTQVINGDETYNLMAKHGIYAYADGTLDPDQAMKMMDEIDKNPLKALKKAFYGKTSFAKGSAVVRGFGSAMANAFLNSIKKPFKKAIDEFGGALANPSGAGVMRWKPYVIKALKLNGFEASAFQVKAWLDVIQRESGGNPRAINLWDSNAKAGHPSMGLVQTIGPRFNAYKFPGHNNPYNGFDDLLAGINYMKHIYGSGISAFTRVADPRIGYANGGYSFTHKFAEISEGNNPEAIIPLSLEKRPRALQLMSEIIADMKGDATNNSTIQQLEANKQRKVSNEKLDQLITLLTELVTGDQYVETSINIDGRKMARGLSKYSRRENAKAQFKGNLGFSNI